MVDMTSEEIRTLDNTYGFTVFAKQEPVIVRGAGVYVWDTEGKKYLDFLSGVAVNSLGHSHPAVVQSLTDQASQLIHMSNHFHTVPQALLAQKLAELSGFDRTFFCNSGAEANEAAIKLARKFGKKEGRSDKFKIITAQRSFHGRTMAALAATGQEKYQQPFAPMLDGFVHVPFNDISALESAMDADVCAVMLEPVQGESGVHPATVEYLEAARRLCDEHDALLVFDEVQTGIARTGHWFAFQHYNVLPDVITLAKGLGGGLPIGACLARGDAAAVLCVGDHGTTFGGNPLVCAGALTVLNIIEEEQLCDHAREMGSYFVGRILLKLGDHVREVRGLGLMLGIELNAPVAKAVVKEALKLGLIANAVGETTLRLLPPLIAQPEHIDEAVVILDRSLTAAKP